MPRPFLRALPLALAAVLTGCVPYAVGTTAAVMPRNEVAPTVTYQFVPVGPDTSAYGGEPGASLMIVDATARLGLDERTELGVRFAGFAGVVADVKYRLWGPDSLGPGMALIGGGGVINAGNNAHLEATLLVSGGARALAVPYGGVRAMQTFPLTAGLRQDAPTFGLFAGLRLGRPDFGVSPEVGVFYDPSVTGLREGDFVVVPSISLHGDRLLRILFGGFPGRRW
jgi:hypothetical protein